MISWRHILAGILLLIFMCTKAAGQYTLHIVAAVPANTNETFLAGNFNDWQPGDANYKLRFLDNQHKEILLHDLKAGVYQFKFNRGSANNIECMAVGNKSKNHSINLKGDTSINVTIEAWSDAYFSMNNLSDSLLYEVLETRAGYYIEINLDSSYKYALQLYRQAQKLKLPYKEARALDLQAAVFNSQGNGEKALALLFKSLAIKIKYNDSSGATALTYYSIAKIYEGVQDFHRAKENYLQSANWINKAHEIYKAESFTAIGNLFLRENKIDTALQYAGKAIQLDKNYPAALLLMGDINEKNGNDRLALENYKAAAIAGFRFAPGNPVYANPAIVYKKIAGIFDKENQTDSAFYYGRKAFAIALAVKNPAVIIATCDVLIKLFAKEKRYDSAFTYQQLLIQKKDSFFTEEKDRQIHNIYYNERFREQELATQDEKQRSQIKFYLLGGLALLLILAGIGYRARMKSRFLKQLADTEMRALRAQMNPHFIFNCLASINRYIVKSDTKSASAYLTKFSKLIRLILDNSANELISVDAEIQTLKLYLEMESLRFDDSFEYEIQADSISRTDNTAIPAMIIQPYVENAIWHGLLHLPEVAGQDKKGKIWLRFLQQGDDMLTVEIEDNGIGRKGAEELKSKDILKTKSYGMQISKDRIGIINKQQDIMSSVTIEDMVDDNGNPTGTKVTLHLPLIEMFNNSYNTKIK